MCYRYKKTAINILCGGASAYGSGFQTRLLDFASNAATIPEQRPGWQGKNFFDFLYLFRYILRMYKIKTTKYFKKWFKKIRDGKIRYRIYKRLDTISRGSFGDHKQIGKNLFELRFFFGPGYRIYYTIQNNNIVFLVVGGDKSSQQQDIKIAKEFLAELEE